MTRTDLFLKYQEETGDGLSTIQRNRDDISKEAIPYVEWLENLILTQWNEQHQ